MVSYAIVHTYLYACMHATNIHTYIQAHIYLHGDIFYVTTYKWYCLTIQLQSFLNKKNLVTKFYLISVLIHWDAAIPG